MKFKNNENINKRISNILNKFDFEQMHKIMGFLNWTWCDESEIPSISNLVLTAQKLLNSCYSECINQNEDYLFIETGGFRVSYDKKYDMFDLFFIPTCIHEDEIID